MFDASIQDSQFTHGTCFGCGPKNPHGLQVKSFARPDGTYVAHWSPAPEHGNGGGAVCGGVLGTVLDCHAAAAAWRALGRWAVTRNFEVEFLRPAPVEPLELVARVAELRPRSAAIEAVARAGGRECTRFRGVFVAPRDGDG